MKKHVIYSDQFDYTDEGKKIAVEVDKVVAELVKKLSRRCANLRELENVIAHSAYYHIATEVLQQKCGVKLKIDYNIKKGK